MKKTKRILALAGVVFLVLLYVSTLITALLKTPYSDGLFMTSLFCTIVIPVFMYMYSLIYKYLKNRNQPALPDTKPAPQIKNIVFDVGNVLVDFSWKELFTNTLHFDQKTSERLAEVMFLNPLWNEFDRGVLSDNEILDSFYQLAPDLKKEIQLVFEHLAETISIKPYTMSWLKDLKSKGYHLYVLSNYPEYTFKRTQEDLCFQSLMEGCIWSYQHKIIKPDPKIYQLLIKKFKLVPSETLFLDDREDNIMAAKEQGLNTLLFTSHEQAVKEMKKIGIR